LFLAACRVKLPEQVVGEGKNMKKSSVIGVLLLAVVWAGVAWAYQGHCEHPAPVVTEEPQQAALRRQVSMSLLQDEVRPRELTPDWRKATREAQQLLVLSQHIHDQLQGGPGRISSSLAGELKQAEQLSKRLRKELRM
jgi:hypothetical protein